MLKKIIIPFIIIISILFIGVFYFKNEVKEQKINTIMDQLTSTLDSQLHLHQMDDLKMALFLSNNEGLVNALENDNEDLGYKILSTITKTIKANTNIDIRAQIITNEYNIFARSWDDIYAGMPIGDYRTDLEYFKQHSTARTSLEVGRRLGIKATVPIYKDGVFLGFIEVISFFKSLTNFFSSIGVDLYVLLDVEHADSAIFMMDNLTISDYIVSNRNYNHKHIQSLNSIDFKELQKSQILYLDGKYFFYKGMYNGNHDLIGAFALVLPQRYLEYFQNPEDDISFLINITRSTLYDIVKEEHYSKNVYNKHDAKSMIYLQDVITKEDKAIYFDEAYNKFDAYTKDELIQILLDKKIVKKIEGKIK